MAGLRFAYRRSLFVFSQNKNKTFAIESAYVVFWRNTTDTESEKKTFQYDLWSKMNEAKKLTC